MTERFVADTARLTERTLRHIARSPDTIMTTTIMPIAFMLLFVYVFGGAMGAHAKPYVHYLLPGILVITIASSVSYTGFRLFMDVQSGLVQRLRSMPVSRASILWAHVCTSLLATFASLGVVVATAVLIGFRANVGALQWCAVVGILTVLTLALTWLAVVAGLSATTLDGATAFSYPLILLPFVSSAFVRTSTMPGPVRTFAELQPVTPIVTALRNLLSGRPVGASIWIALAWCMGILVASYALAMPIFRRRAR